jgi:hypothetical protein
MSLAGDNFALTRCPGKEDALLPAQEASNMTKKKAARVGRRATRVQNLKPKSSHTKAIRGGYGTGVYRSSELLPYIEQKVRS